MSTLDALDITTITVPDHLTLWRNSDAIRPALILGDDRGCVEVSTLFGSAEYGGVDIHSRDPREGLDSMDHCRVLDGPCHGAGTSMVGPSEIREALQTGDGPALVAAMTARHRQVFDQ
ncbi:hypothetical protein SAMN04487905_10648 [Actinopolyspora xinjiangensis]|uniref:Uncharacterized protein n=1 Tax=Actinopolyspora xinjiangensis TaxID=405564 RepID=A0A1H0U592_9ACTN|nr:hypothetical protein [Actinopolyspora xinjiangensis]SDP61155.1 hypothetical protein SAMN04487905_10648 [Actinopolyspora xinjiangensis]